MSLRLSAGRFFGRVERSAGGGAVRFTESCYQRGLDVPLHTHEHAHFCLVLAGSYRETLRGREWERNPGTLIYYPPEEPHAERHAADGRHFLIELDSRWLNEFGERPWPLEPLSAQGGPLVAIGTRAHHEIQVADAATDLMLEGLALELAAATVRATGEGRRPRRWRAPWLARAIELLHADYSSAISLDDVARAAGVHPAHLTRVFRRELGCSVGGYLRELRCAEAERRIRETDEPFATIAAATGFADQSHLGRLIKRRTGRTPRRLRADPA